MNIHQETIYNHLLDSIMVGELAVSEQIPTETELGKKFKTNRMNAHLAIKQLEHFGILRRNKRQGTFVNKIPSPIITGELKSVNTRRVCVLNHNNPLYSQIHWNERIINAFENKIMNNKTEMVFKDISHLNSLDEFRSYIKTIAEEGYNSLVIVCDYFIDSIISEHPEVFFQFHNNVFIFDRGTSDWHNWPYTVVSVNLFREGVIAAEYLLQQGYGKIIYVKDDDNYCWAEERERGLQSGFSRGTEGKIQAQIFKMHGKDEAKVLDIIKSSNEKIAIAAQNDSTAISIFQKAVKRNLKPGIDFGLLGFDDNIKFREFDLTTISPPLEKIGSRLADLVISKLNGRENDEISSIRIDSKLIIRKTC